MNNLTELQLRIIAEGLSRLENESNELFTGSNQISELLHITLMETIALVNASLLEKYNEQ